MPLYTFKCDDCNKVEEELRPMKEARLPARCRHCGGSMTREFSVPRVHGDKEAGSADFDASIQDRAEMAEDIGKKGYTKKRVRNVFLARSLCRVPGLPKMRGKDGRLYAVFTSKADRDRKLKNMGLAAE